MGFIKGMVRRSLMDELLSARRAGGAINTDAGISVTPDVADSYSAWYAGIRILSDGVAGLPLKIYERQPDGGRRDAPEHPYYSAFHSQPNPEMSAIEFVGMLQGHALGRGNGYAKIDYNGAGVPIFWPLNPERMRVERIDGIRRYNYTNASGQSKPYTDDEVLHLRGRLGSDGLTGLSVVALARNSIGLGLVTEKHGGRIFKNGAMPGTAIIHPGKLSETAEQNLINSWEARHRGVDNAGLVGVLAEGVTLETVGFSAEDSQFLETRQFQVVEAARWIGVPPHLIFDLLRSTNNNIEQQSLEFVIYFLRPWLIRWEQAINNRFFADRRYFVEFSLDGLLRGDTKSRYEAHALGRQWGFLATNDIRRVENKPPVPGGDDDLIVPLNMITLKEVLAGGPAVPPAARSCDCGEKHEIREERAVREVRSRYAKSRAKLRERYAPMFRQMATQIVNREKADVMRKAEKVLVSRSTGSMANWLDDFYQNKMPDYIQKQSRAVYQSFIAAVNESAASQGGVDLASEGQIMEWTKKYTERFGTGYSLDSLRRLKSIINDSSTPLDDVRAQFDDWQENRPEKTYMFSSVCLIGAVCGATWLSGGITREVWVSSGGCPICQELDGRTAGIEELFVAAGNHDIGGQTTTISRDIMHPPLHTYPGECDCDVAPA